MTRTFAALLCLSIGSGAVLAATHDPITLKFSPTKGQVLTYTMTASLDLQGTTRMVEAKRIETILDASDANYKSKWDFQEVTVDGTAQPDQPEEVTVSKPTGEMISIENSEMGRTAALDRLYYPSAPVSVGDKWSYSGTKDDKLGTVAYKADMKLLGDEKVGDTDTWKIQEDLKESEGENPATVHNTVWLDKKDGSVVKITSSFVDYRLTSGVPLPMSGSLTYLRK